MCDYKYGWKTPKLESTGSKKEDSLSTGRVVISRLGASVLYLGNRVGQGAKNCSV